MKQGRQCTCNVTLRRVRAAVVLVEKQKVLPILSVCVCVCVALDTQHAVHMQHAAICGMPGFTVFLHLISLTVRFLKCS
jgi:hypothetical protein